MKREIPTDWTTFSHSQDDTFKRTNEPAHKHRPMSPMEALMSAAPNEPIETSQLEMLALRDVLADAIDALPMRHRWVFEQHVIGRVPVRQLGEWMGLGKSYVWLLVQEAKEMLRESLADQPIIAEYLTRHDIEDEDE